MSNRFSKRRSEGLRRLIYCLPILLLLVIGILFYRGVSSVGRSTSDKQLETLQTALHRSITQCYAVEGIYPPSLSYLEDSYGLTYDKELFFVDYLPISSNIYPDVTILYLGDHNSASPYDFLEQTR